jgi:asparagine synthase (glutamine-hydrolysing)
VRFKIGAGNDNGAVGKQILRAVSRRLLPPSSDKNPKQGFSAPDETWFAKDSSRFVLSNILEKDNNLFDVLDQKWVENIVNGHMSGTVNKRLMIWSLLSLSFLLETM